VTTFIFFKTRIFPISCDKKNKKIKNPSGDIGSKINKIGTLEAEILKNGFEKPFFRISASKELYLRDLNKQ